MEKNSSGQSNTLTMQTPMKTNARKDDTKNFEKEKQRLNSWDSKLLVRITA